MNYKGLIQSQIAFLESQILYTEYVLEVFKNNAFGLSDAEVATKIDDFEEKIAKHNFMIDELKKKIY